MSTFKWTVLLSKDTAIPTELFPVGGDNGPVIWCQNPQLSGNVANAMNAQEANDDLQLLLTAAEVAMTSDGENRDKAIKVYETLKERYNSKTFTGR
ncbi:TPA: hypothetical protein DDW69_00185 [candidate division CPR2 bacterium]|uniref:Uncharacterized protein n=1 Tax=candidate division CPR2 bacterium GW2011_GWC1_41_48 TaxID=1618344 RepID=A0A0G0W6Y4_UNCC2|nr:MAG: hypothetical protein UT47_C0005G0031 [candidate division CPR2 bacterium GW2011_GWC2_39_35]KKR29449.1 MAG: hypothetical protein UT59_C0007G0003 [candidate division CPR2 bacterium GW2011_GWD1_39_7]KKS08720.1 MAG: hypothetical protein UU65_C0005G0031 [candidate division CPR2 bacterium GW2011_GWC1_41_48]OGB55608.1 MAG: hypothetical protein A2Y27_03170 [candidate division CPR2 bacterium GWD1_39_7]HBG81243.1 hypothetical protein [candidate division CPR2 bacterium]